MADLFAVDTPTGKASSSASASAPASTSASTSEPSAPAKPVASQKQAPGKSPLPSSVSSARKPSSGSSSAGPSTSTQPKMSKGLAPREYSIPRSPSAERPQVLPQGLTVPAFQELLRALISSELSGAIETLQQASASSSVSGAPQVVTSASGTGLSAAEAPSASASTLPSDPIRVSQPEVSVRSRDKQRRVRRISSSSSPRSSRGSSPSSKPRAKHRLKRSKRSRASSRRSRHSTPPETGALRVEELRLDNPDLLRSPIRESSRASSPGRKGRASIPRTPGGSPRGSLRRTVSPTPSRSRDRASWGSGSGGQVGYSRQASPFGSVEKSRSPSPPARTSSFSKFVHDMAKALGVDLTAGSHYTSDFLEEQDSPVPQRESPRLPLHKVLLHTLLRNLETPLTVAVVPTKMESKYRTLPPKGFDKGQLSHQSLLVESALKRTQPSRVSAAVPPGREGRTLDKFGRRLYANSQMATRVLNYAFAYSSYLRSMIKDLPDFQGVIPESHKVKFAAFASNLSQLRFYLFHAVYDAFELASRVSACAVAMRRLAWLRTLEMDPNLQERLANLPCIGSELFDDSLDAATKKLSEQERSLASLVRPKPKPPAQRPFKQPPRRYPQKSTPAFSRPPPRRPTQQGRGGPAKAAAQGVSKPAPSF
uniref:Pneumococcal serine-rich repeat protein-like n=1 Tax=Geotrypetes seraphini TaxID=260995 RepID=A0A6P8PL78_GEOSA|nr:pneumococcal serine-rich repeat protein-like [Geotrypetes seraphini]